MTKIRISDRDIAIFCALGIIGASYAVSDKNFQQFFSKQLDGVSTSIKRGLMTDYDRKLEAANTILAKATQTDPPNMEGLLEAQDLAFSAQKMRPQASEPHSVLMHVKVGSRAYSAALFEADKVLASNPHDADAMRIRAWAHFKLGQYDQAYREAKQALDGDKYNPDAVFVLAECACALNRSDEAIELYKRMISSGDKTFRPELGLGNVCFSLKLYDDAKQHYDRALSISKRGEIYARRAHAYYRLLSKKCLDDMEKAVELDPNNPEYLCDFAEMYTACGRPDKAVDLLDYPLERDFADNDRMKKQMRTSALLLVKHGREGLKYRPRSADFWGELASGLYFSGEPDAALDAANKAISFNPNSVDALRVRGRIYRQSGRLKEAIADYSRALQLDPSDKELYFKLALVQQDANDHAASVQNYKKYLRWKPNSSAAYNNLGVSYASLEMNDDAIAMYRKAIELDPTESLAMSNLSRAYLRSGNVRDCLAYAQRAVACSPLKSSSHAMLADALVAAGQFDNGLTEAWEAARLDPSALDTAIYLMAKAGQPKEAIERANKAVLTKLSKDARWQLGKSLAFAYLVNNQPEGVVQSLRNATPYASFKDPENDGFIYGGTLWVAYKLLGDEARASEAANITASHVAGHNWYTRVAKWFQANQLNDELIAVAKNNNELTEANFYTAIMAKSRGNQQRCDQLLKEVIAKGNKNYHEHHWAKAMLAH